MVCSSINAAHTIEACRDTTSNVCGKDAVGGDSVQALEECEHVRVGDRSALQRIDLLDDDVRMSDQSARRINLSGRCVIICGWVDE